MVTHVVKTPYIQRFVYSVIATVGTVVVFGVMADEAQKAYKALKAKWNER